MAEAKDHMVFHRSLTDLSNEIADVIEHLVIPKIVTACWDRGLDVDVLHADIDSGGYDVVLEAAPTTGKGIFPIRHIQFKASYRRARPRAVHMNIERRRGGCIVWVIWDRQPDGLIEVRRILFYGASPSKPMPPIQGVYVRRPGRQGRRRATKKMTSTQFMDVADFPELARKLFPQALDPEVVTGQSPHRQLSTPRNFEENQGDNQRLVNEMAHSAGGNGRFLKSDWWRLLEDELGRRHLTDLMAFVDANGAGVFPPRDDVFRALELTPPEETKAVIVGQDPYHSPGQAHGLCFSVRSGFKPLPRSLRTILRELKSDGFRASDDGNLEPWASQGVLLLNTSLTVQAGKPGSDSERWWLFTDAVIRIAARDADPVFLLWGARAQSKKPIITGTRGSEARILESSHPAPPACYRPCGDSPAFVESHPFTNTNQLLKSSEHAEIVWNLV